MLPWIKVSLVKLMDILVLKDQRTYRSIRLEVFCKICVLRNFAKFTGKHLCPSLFFNKVGTGVFLWIFVKFLRIPFLIEHLWWLLQNIANIFKIFLSATGNDSVISIISENVKINPYSLTSHPVLPNFFDITFRISFIRIFIYMFHLQFPFTYLKTSLIKILQAPW